MQEGLAIAFLLAGVVCGIALSLAWLRFQKHRRSDEQHVASSCNQERYRSIAELSSDMIVAIGVDRRRHYVSRASKRILGFEPEEMIGENPLSGIHPDDRAHVTAVSESLLRGVKDCVTRYRHMHKDGHYVWLEASFHVAFDPISGEPREFVGLVRDISDREQGKLEAEAVIAHRRESHRLLEMAETIAKVGHWRLDLVGNALFWSDEVYRIHGVPEDHEPVLAEAMDFYHPEDRGQIGAAVERSIASGADLRFEARIVRADGSVRHVISEGQAELTNQGLVVGIFGVFKDVTDDVLAKRELREALDRAEQAAGAKNAFLANMSHEIRTPMNGVLGFAKLLAEADLSEVQRRQAEMILESGNSMMRLLNDILDLSKIEAGRITMMEDPVDLRHVIGRSIELFAPIAEEKGLQLQCGINDDLPRWIRGDKLRLRQIIGNLLNNAVKFSDKGTIGVTAEISSDRKVPRLELKVRDSGIGIDQSAHERIFEGFAQANSAIHQQFGGTGLGLPISRELARLMGGDLTVESQIGEGSVFTLSIPVHEAIVRESDTTEVSSTARKSLEGRVLVAEDNEINQLLLSAMLEKLGVEFQIVTDGKQAVTEVAEAASKDEPYDMILMDIQMPEMDGYEASRELRSAGARLPIIALTANAFPEDRDRALNSGMQGHLSKPVSLEQLQEALGSHLPSQSVR